MEQKPIGRLILFVGVYDTLDIFMYDLCDTFKKVGYETMLFDSSKMEKSLAQLGGFINEKVTAVVTFNNLGFNMELRAGHNLWDDLQIPVVNILMDHPFCYYNALVNAPINSIVLCPDCNHMKYIQRFHPNISITGFLPHGGKELPGIKKKLCERSIDVIYAGGLSLKFSKDIIPEFEKYDFNLEKVCEDAKKIVLENPHMTSEDGLIQALSENEIILSDEELCKVIAEAHYIDLQIVSFYREKVVESIARAGINITIYGFGWDICDWINLPNVYYGGRIAAEEIVEKMGDAKIVLSTMTWFKDGTHDRVFNGMLQGALTCSDTSIYMKEEFSGGLPDDNGGEQEMILFELDQIDELADRIKIALNDLDGAQLMADRGYVHAREEHTWEHRAKELHEDLLSQL